MCRRVFAGLRRVTQAEVIALGMGSLGACSESPVPGLRQGEFEQIDVRRSPLRLSPGALHAKCYHRTYCSIRLRKFCVLLHGTFWLVGSRAVGIVPHVGGRARQGVWSWGKFI